MLFFCINQSCLAEDKKIESPFKQANNPPITTPAAVKTAPPVINTARTEKKAEVKEAKVEKKVINPLFNPKNQLGIAAAENNITKTFNLIQQNKLTEAKKIIEPTSDWLTKATEYHANLFKVLRDIDTAKVQSELERDLALRFAILRDKALYQLALLNIEEKKPQEAVEKLVNIVRSQPKTQLGFNAYQVLQQIGFTYKVQIPKTADSTNNGEKDEKTN